MNSGDRSRILIESKITQVYDNVSLRGLGYFVIYIKNYRYGVYSDEATALGCSFDSIKERIDMRGKHIAQFSTEKKPELIAEAVKNALYTDNTLETTFFGIPINEFSDIIYKNKIIWAPDGDEAFDDGSYILQFDVDRKVRIIGFKCLDNFRCDPKTVNELWIDAKDFYDTLQEWYNGFLNEWKDKVSKLN